jgi:hypothetical protein
MPEQRINPEKVTKPIQLLAAWLVGLILVNASFLLGAQQITKPDWASSLLVIAAVLNVPVFIVALFLLQTKFRPQMQEDSYYAQYLQQERYQTVATQSNASAIAEQEVAQTTERLVKRLGLEARGKEEPIAELLRQSQQEVLLHKHGTTRTIAEIFIDPQGWENLVDKYEKDPSFIRDIEGLLADGLVERLSDDYRTVRLTPLGTEVAEKAQEQGMLFSQRKTKLWESMRKRVKRS